MNRRYFDMHVPSPVSDWPELIVSEPLPVVESVLDLATRYIFGVSHAELERIIAESPVYPPDTLAEYERTYPLAYRVSVREAHGG